MQVDADSKIIFVHIPRTGGSWFGHAWDSNTNKGRINLRGKYLTNNENGKYVLCGRHGHLSGILKKLDEIEYDYKDHKIITLIRHPVDRIASSWAWFSKVKRTAERHGWKSIHDMIDEYESAKLGQIICHKLFGCAKTTQSLIIFLNLKIYCKVTIL